MFPTRAPWSRIDLAACKRALVGEQLSRTHRLACASFRSAEGISLLGSRMQAAAIGQPRNQHSDAKVSAATLFFLARLALWSSRSVRQGSVVSDLVREGSTMSVTAYELRRQRALKLSKLPDRQARVSLQSSTRGRKGKKAHLFSEMAAVSGSGGWRVLDARRQFEIKSCLTWQQWEIFLVRDCQNAILALEVRDIGRHEICTLLFFFRLSLSLLMRV